MWELVHTEVHMLEGARPDKGVNGINDAFTFRTLLPLQNPGCLTRLGEINTASADHLSRPPTFDNGGFPGFPPNTPIGQHMSSAGSHSFESAPLALPWTSHTYGNNIYRPHRPAPEVSVFPLGHASGP